ncbi:MAG: A/G-specific adenine glycosylase [Thermomicrobiales bacterium]
MDETSSIPKSTIEDFQQHLLAWWQENRRNLPWRQTRDPYEVLVSEMMLQQTQVDRVIPYFRTWLESYPTVYELAAAPTADVIRLWKGLGYNRRAVNLQKTAKAIVEMGGEFPRDVEALRALPGIGPYTAGAVACFAFEQDVAFMDTNMRRVLHRVLVGVDIPRPQFNDRQMSAIALQLVPTDDGWNWNQALIEFGALQCTARKPNCLVCGLQDICVARPQIQTAIAENVRPPGLKREVFKDTNRYFRGRVVDALRDRAGITFKELGPLIRPEFSESDGMWLLEVVEGLERDGLAKIAEISPEYDSQSLMDVIVTLP